MRSAARASHPSSQPQTQHPTRENEELTQGSQPARAETEGNRKYPPSILRPSRPDRGCHDNESRRTSRHVRFREPLEVAVHYITHRDTKATVKVPSRSTSRGGPLLQLAPRNGSLFLWLTVCVLLGAVLGLYCGKGKPVTVALEDLRAWLRVLILRLWHVVLACWHC
uniref:RIKEN cDNA A530016L24 gene n=2 Tax=Nannospalax galili TaxID=1026970 RepID=A0A8C6R5E4_NANGA